MAVFLQLSTRFNILETRILETIINILLTKYKTNYFCKYGILQTVTPDICEIVGSWMIILYYAYFVMGAERSTVDLVYRALLCLFFVVQL